LFSSPLTPAIPVRHPIHIELSNEHAFAAVCVVVFAMLRLRSCRSEASQSSLPAGSSASITLPPSATRSRCNSFIFLRRLWALLGAVTLFSTIAADMLRPVLRFWTVPRHVAGLLAVSTHHQVWVCLVRAIRLLVTLLAALTAGHWRRSIGAILTIMAN
jgi:hypothetical protein